MDRTKALACLVCLCLTGCSRPDKIVIGSKNFTEQLILGEILAQQTERSLKIRVERRLNLGGTMLAQQALIAGAIDLYPEYTGTALTAILRQQPETDAKNVRNTVKKVYAERFNLAWMEPFGFNNTFAMVIRKTDAKGIGTLTEAAAARAWKLGVGYEFLQRPDGYPGLSRTYGLRAEGNPVTMDLGLLYTALRGGQVDMVAANSTDGMLAVLDATVLRDDRHYFPPYECAAVVRKETLSKYPQLEAAINTLGGKISAEKMRELNYAVDGQHRSVAEVASAFLNSLNQKAELKSESHGKHPN